MTNINNSHSLPLHPLQSKEWGDFRKKTGLKMIKIADGFQMTIHKIPYLPFFIGYLPKCGMPTKKILAKLAEIGKKEKCVFIKLEPNTISQQFNNLTMKQLVQSPHPLFTQYTFHLDLSKSESEILAGMKPKTRYNIKVAQKHGVKVVKDNSDKAFETYIALSKETWKRQRFYGHDEKYHRLMWETLHPADIAHLLIAYYQPPTRQSDGQANNKQLNSPQYPLASWIIFLYNGVLYYPYGASSNEYKHLMASNLMMWETIKWGKAHGAKFFDMWGCLEPDPNPKDPWYGFHKFKEGYGGKLVEFVGSYDLIISPLAYKIYNLIYPIRQKLLQISS